MRNCLISVSIVLGFLWIGCDGSGPFETDELALKEPRTQALVDSSVYIASGGFAPGYLSGNLQSDELTLHWNCEDPTDFLCYKVFLQRSGFPESAIAQINQFETNEIPIANLQQDTQYNIRLERVDRNGMHIAHTLSLKTARWLPPDNVLINGLSPTQVNVTWTDRSDNEQNFYLTLEKRDDVTGLFYPISNISTQANITTYQMTLPDFGSVYRVSVQARSAYEENSMPVVSPNYVPQLEPVGLLHATQADDSRMVELTWVDNSTLETSIEVDRFLGNQPQENDWNTVAVLPTNTTSWIDADTTTTRVGDTIHYRVRCVNTYLGIRTETDWRSTNLTLTAPSMMPPWEYEIWDGNNELRFINANDHNVYLYHALDDLDIELCPDSWNMDFVVEIYGADGHFIGTYNNGGVGQCEFLYDIYGYNDYIIDVYEQNGMQGYYYLLTY